MSDESQRFCRNRKRISYVNTLNRRAFIRTAAAGAWAMTRAAHAGAEYSATTRPNLVFVFADQWRAQATGYAGDPNAHTPNLDRLAAQSVNCANAVSTCPVCSPYRGSLMTGCYPLTHGVFLNDVPLAPDRVSFADVLNDAGYLTGYIGKWHLDGHGRSAFIPPERRQGFAFWRAQECTHDYNRSHYFADTDQALTWEGYDALAQTREAQRFLREDAGDNPFALFISWGPPHNPYETAPEEFRALFDPEKIALRPNVPEPAAAEARRDLAGYYAHGAALDACLGMLLTTLDELGLSENTVFVFTSDHGDMLGSRGEQRKQRPWDEAVRVPLLVRFPARLGAAQREVACPIATPDLMPTLLRLMGVTPPAVEGHDYSEVLAGAQPAETDAAALIACYTPFGEWTRGKGGREYRGIRTAHHTYVRSLDGPWLLYDNEADPYQMSNLCDDAARADLRNRLDSLLQAKLDALGDRFLPGPEYIRQWGYTVDANGTAPYAP